MARALEEEPLGRGLRRIALDLVDESLSRLSRGPDPKADEHVHETRKRGKELRALFRLARPALGEGHYRRLDKRVRDASRHLAPLRDAHALLETFDELVDAEGATLATRAGGVRDELGRRARAASASVHEDDERIAAAIELLRKVRADLDGWALPDEWPFALAGIGRIHRQGVRGLERSADGGDVHAFHDWRKRVKYLWHQLQVLDRVAPTMLQPFASACKVLSDTIGDAHDLHVLGQTVLAEPGPFGGDAEVRAVADAAEHWRADLEHRAVGFGTRLFAETTTAFVARLDRYWQITDELGPEPVAGGLEVVGAAVGQPGSGPRARRSASMR